MAIDRQVEIAMRAYSIWEVEGRPNGRDLDHWLRAEAEVERARNGVAQEISEPPVKPPRPRKRRAPRTK
ncbi:MAG TPA: DUF2934 domain-containing protein [Stellaceae bacterium]|nr:DUF2934 domain-containing protein [Stellaceae bacterium]